MTRVGVDSSVATQAKSVTLAWLSAKILRWLCIHHMNQLNLLNGKATMTAA